MVKPKILITNDDGIHAPGIKHLCNALKDHAELTVVAPALEQSAVGLSITIRAPLHIQKVEWAHGIPAWSVSGTPADCVKLGLKVILDDKPDFVISGINRGTNSGRNVLYSGTVGGAIESVMQDVPAIALSCFDFMETAYAAAEGYIPAIVAHASQYRLPRGTLLNVNFPSHTIGPIQGFRMTRQGLQYWVEHPSRREHPAEGHTYYWLGARLAKFEEHEDSDIHWLNKGYITAVPVHVGELTDHSHLAAAKEHFNKILITKQ